ncbi:MAG: hypothetical protein CMH17_10995 [Methylophaga sp.]|jgi:protein SCO1/2|nr:hypothetical protein [Methylophaga sp.]HBX59536.1 hypothetical protein [Methylophaga sp.]HCO01721.1 hypothetical protein [Methylophaga sp.]|tara:strand:- start:1845 stop:2471 length:627 start_codon:yes stop_codon:yes gene_type:complete
MQNMFKNVHSKRFLLTYLSLVVLLLLLFLTLSQQPPPAESSNSSSSMLTVFEPTLEIPQFLAYTSDHSVFTNDAFSGKWSFVYIPSVGCHDCEAIFRVLKNLKDGLANRSVQLVLIDIGGQQIDELTALVHSHDVDARIITVNGTPSENKSLKNFFTRSRAYPEQDLENAVFLINPRALLAARFQAPFTSVLIRQSFIQLRSDYAVNH